MVILSKTFRPRARRRLARSIEKQFLEKQALLFKSREFGVSDLPSFE